MSNEDKILRKKKFVLDALKRCLDREAYSYISMQDVANEAGISKGGLRYYFPTKESLYMELIADFFDEIEKGHLSMVDASDSNEDKAVLSTLFGIESFVLNGQNIKIFINLILYGLEDPKIMEPIRHFFRNHLDEYRKIIRQARYDGTPINKNEFDLQFIARITQVIFLSTGLLEAVDPIGLDPSKLTRYVISLFKDLPRDDEEPKEPAGA